MVRSRLASLLVVTVLGAMLSGCALTLGRPAPLGTGQVHARVVTGAGGARLVLVPVYISGRGPYDFALDTGAARTVVDTRLSNLLHLPASGPEQTVTGVAGTVEAVRVRISDWRVDTITLPSTTVLSLRLAAGGGPPLDGLFGSDMLSRFRTVTIDYAGQTVTLS
jgi:hypothetical protein